MSATQFYKHPHIHSDTRSQLTRVAMRMNTHGVKWHYFVLKREKAAQDIPGPDMSFDCAGASAQSGQRCHVRREGADVDVMRASGGRA